MRKNLPIILTLLFGVLLSGGASYFVEGWEHTRLRAQFEGAANDRLEILRKHIFSTIEALQSLGGLFVASGDVDRDAFKQFTAPVLTRHPGIQALGWNPRVDGPERRQFVEAARRGRFPDFRFTERQAQGQMITAASRPEYFPAFSSNPWPKTNWLSVSIWVPNRRGEQRWTQRATKESLSLRRG